MHLGSLLLLVRHAAKVAVSVSPWLSFALVRFVSLHAPFGADLETVKGLVLARLWRILAEHKRKDVVGGLETGKIEGRENKGVSQYMGGRIEREPMFVIVEWEWEGVLAVGGNDLVRMMSQTSRTDERPGCSVSTSAKLSSTCEGGDTMYLRRQYVTKSGASSQLFLGCLTL